MLNKAQDYLIKFYEKDMNISIQAEMKDKINFGGLMHDNLEM